MKQITQCASYSPFATVADALADNGFHVLPIMPLRKAPGEYNNGRWYPMRNWQRFRLHPASAHQIAIWKTWPNANIGVLTGTPAGEGHVLAAVDVDTDDLAIQKQVLASLPHSPFRKKSKRGFTIFLRVAVGTKGFRSPIVELLTDTRQTVIPPSIHPDTGRPYEWMGEATLMNVRAREVGSSPEGHVTIIEDWLPQIDKLAPLLSVIADHCETKQFAAPFFTAPRGKTVILNNFTQRRGERAAQAALVGEARKLAAMMPGTGRNGTLNAISYGMGRFVVAGFVSESAVIRELDRACVASGLMTDDGPAQCRATILSGLKSGFAAGPVTLLDRQRQYYPTTQSRALPPHDRETGEIDNSYSQPCLKVDLVVDQSLKKNVNVII